MRLAFVIDRIATEKPRATTVILALAAARLGHDVHLLDAGDLTRFANGHVGGLARTVPARDFATSRELLQALQARDAPRDVVSSAELDVLWMRHNPSEWSTTELRIVHSIASIGHIAVNRGVLVLDHPETVAHAGCKIYLQNFPEEVQPRTLVTRDAAEVRSFYEVCGHRIVLKPLNGYAGENVFLVLDQGENLNSIVETIARQDFVIAQEYLPAAREGDVRLFMMNGKPLEAEGKIAAIRRRNPPGDFRANLSAGAKADPVVLDDRMLELADLVGPRLARDGIFLAGLDIAGDKLLEINALSPGGLNSASKQHGVDFAGEVIRAVERKLEYRGRVGNQELAGMWTAEP